jgi:hypothetical protein
MDIQGRLIRVLKVNASESNDFGGDLKSGIYMIEFNNGFETRTLKVVKE